MAEEAHKVGIPIFDDVEVLDFCGPFEVFGVTGVRDGPAPFEVFTVAERDVVRARNGLSIKPHHTLKTCPQPDILVIPGGGGYHPNGTPFGTRLELDNEILLNWIARMSENAKIVFSVCTGALLLAKLGMLENQKATTHHLAFDTLAGLEPSATVLRQRVVDNGKVILSGGISAGIDASFHIVSRLLGEDAAKETARYMEYDWPRGSLA